MLDVILIVIFCTTLIFGSVEALVYVSTLNSYYSDFMDNATRAAKRRSDKLLHMITFAEFLDIYNKYSDKWLVWGGNTITTKFIEDPCDEFYLDEGNITIAGVPYCFPTVKDYRKYRKFLKKECKDMTKNLNVVKGLTGNEL